MSIFDGKLKVKQDFDGLSANHEGARHKSHKANGDSYAVKVIVEVHL